MFRLPVLMLVSAMTAALPTYAGSLEIVIENTEVAEGELLLRVLKGESEFNGEQNAIAQIQQRASKGEMRFVLSNLPAGDYAIQIMHDVNGNGELDTNFVGIPSEPWAFSNNATGRMGPPK